ncbi:NAD-dependent protein deacylase [Atopobacter phocae]|uniref:NAD-dependent protein deacylase n=1 Tax=Atopobacter phocae TaxID=136492 RepID=UPI000471D7F9|nr:NAD-dependent protein deacylase [Atopobacter phocae]
MNQMAFNQLAQELKIPQRIVVLTGAGISTASGIPDFRSSGGLFNQLSGQHYTGEEALSIKFLKENPKLFYQNFLDHIYYPDAQPNRAHDFLAKLEKNGHHIQIVTQNIDELHQKAGSSQVYEVHGSAMRFETMEGEPVDLKDVTQRDGLLVNRGEIVRPAITLYGEMLDQQVLEAAVSAFLTADIMLVMGTSLKVYPVASLPSYFTGRSSYLINRDPTPYDSLFTACFHENINTVVKALEKQLEQ